MSAQAALEAVLRRLASEKPHLEKSFHAWLEALVSGVAPAEIGPSELLCLLKLTYATEFAWVEPRTILPHMARRGELAAFADLLYAVASPDYRFASSLLAAYPRLGVPIGHLDSDIRAIAAASASTGIKGHEALDLSFSFPDGKACRFMLAQMALVARHSPATLGPCVRLIAARGPKIGMKSLREWIERGTDLMTSARVEEGVKVLLLESSAGRRILGMHQASLDDFRNTLKIYIASLAGRDLAVNALGLSMYGIKSPYTDGATAFLPAEIPFFRDEGLNRGVYSSIAAIQAASVAMGSFSLDFQALPFKTELRERYATLLPEIPANLRRIWAGMAESVRERKDGEFEAVFPNDRRLSLLKTEYETLFFSLPTPDFARELFCLVENFRITCALGALYPGLRKDFRLLNLYRWQARREPGAEIPPEFRQFIEYLDAAIGLACPGRRGAAPRDARITAFLDEVGDALSALEKPESTAQDSALAMFNIYNAFYDRFRLTIICQKLNLRERFADFAVPALYPEVVRAVAPGLLKAEDAADFVPEETEKIKAWDFTTRREGESGGADLRQAIAAGRTKVYRYREFDHLRGGYLPNRCTLFESVLPSKGGEAYERALSRWALVFKQTRKRFLAMKPDDVELSRGWYDGNEMNVSDMVDYALSLRRGESPDEKIYCRKVLNRRDLAVAILLDASNSTGAGIGDTTVIDVERDSLAILASALDAIGDTFALFAFNSAGPNKVYFNVIKDFHEAWGKAAQGRIGSVEPYESNRDGCAIRHAAARLARRPEKVKLLLLLSDGIPADIDYGPQAGMRAGTYAIEDTRMAIIEARELGITPFCINIDTQAKDYAARLYGAFHFVILNDVGRLPERLSRLYLRITA